MERDRYESIYFREPSGVLFEIATRSAAADPAMPRRWQGEIHLVRTPLAALPPLRRLPAAGCRLTVSPTGAGVAAAACG